MAITNYTELQEAIKSRLQRSDLDSIIPDFISLAEVRLSRKLRVSGLESVSTISCVAGTQNYALPSDFRAIRSVSISGDPVRNLEYLTPDNADKYFGISTTAKPYAYSVIGGELYLFYTPDTDYTVNLIYYAAPVALSNTNQTNYFMTNTPDALLYAALGEAATHLKDDAALQRWASLYDRAILDIQEADANDKWSGANMRVRVA